MHLNSLLCLIQDGSTDASAPTLTLNNHWNIYRGEKITGSSSGATARIIDITSPASYVLASATDFTTSDTITGDSLAQVQRFPV